MSACNVGDPGSIPGSGRSSEEGNGNPLQYPCLENPMDGGTWYATVHGVTKSRTQLSNFTFTFLIVLENLYFSKIIVNSFENNKSITKQHFVKNTFKTKRKRLARRLGLFEIF